MSKKKLFDEDSEEEDVSFKTENEYAKKYDNWREKEELYKLEQKYGSKGLSGEASASSDSEDESDEPPEVTEEMETQFLKTLALLKTKDPRIYDPGYKFFDEKEQKVEEEKPKAKTVTFEDSDDDDDSNDGNIFKVEKKAEIAAETSDKNTSSDRKTGKDNKIKDFLTGKAEHVDETVEQDLAPLKALWSDPKLQEGEAFLRDYILNKRYLEDGAPGSAEDRLRDDEDLEADERRVEEQGRFERAYNFRFEEPDDEYLKRYPRTMNYTRPKDDRRARKRAEVRARKEEEKRRKMDEIARMKALKLKEIQQKISKIKEVTGNEELAFKEEDIEGDFDPEEHDRRMRALFDERYYGDVDDRKPVFPDLDDELEIENWDKYEPEQTAPAAKEDEPHCEDEDFNMDAEYDPKQARASLLEEIQSTLGKKRRNRKKKSKLAELLTMEKPKFVPTVADKTYNEYMEEYYKMDCEDVIGGDLPTRFKYRECVPNDYGLTVEEILLADDKELTQWVPLKKIVKHRPADVERSEVNSYRQRAADRRLKMKVLPSLFKDLPEEPEIVVPIEEATKKKKRKKKNKSKSTEQSKENDLETETNALEDNSVDEGDNVEVKGKKKKKNKSKKADQSTENDQNSESNVLEDNYENSVIEADDSTEVKGKKKKKKHKGESEINTDIVLEQNVETTPKKHKKKYKNAEENIESIQQVGKDKKQKEKEQDSIIDENAIINENKHKKKHKGLVDSSDLQSKEIHKKENATKAHLAETENNISMLNGTTSGVNKTKKKPKPEGLIVENVKNVEPSHTGYEGNKRKDSITEEDVPKVNLKRKLDQPNQVQSKRQKFNKTQGKKDFKNKKKLNQKDNFKIKHGKDSASDNPLNKLSDERLKAYGLNPKKYRSFLKYKKF